MTVVAYGLLVVVCWGTPLAFPELFEREITWGDWVRPEWAGRADSEATTVLRPWRWGDR